MYQGLDMIILLWLILKTNGSMPERLETVRKVCKPS